MRQMILMAAALTMAMLLPRAALAFETDMATATNPDGSARFADPDEAPALPGGLQILGQTGDIGYTGAVNIPQSPPSSEVPPWLYSTPAFRSAP